MMDYPVEDYYDMSVELLPSANFAGRPTSDISMLDGLWTMVISSSEEDNEDDSEDIASQPRPRTPPQPLQTQPESPESPKIMVTSPSIDDVRPSRLRGLSNDVKVLERPRLRRKAQTAPVGAVDLEPPLEPRRAIIARLGYSNSNQKTQPQPYNEGDRSWTVKGSCSDVGSKPQKALPTLSKQEGELLSSETAQDQDEDSSSPVKQLPGSFSDKARVRETLDKKQVRTLNTALADYSSPSSMLSTPRELYAIPEQLATSETMGSPRTSRSFKRRSGRSIKPISPKARSSLTQSGIRNSNELKRKDDTKDADAAKRQRIYLPGPIMLAQHPAQLRKDSVASLDPFAVDSKLDSPGRRMSDIVGLETIVTFFEEFGVIAEVTNTTLDQYWLHESESSDDTVEDVDARKESITSVEEKPPQIPWVTRSHRGSKFSFSSASSTEPPPEKRKRNRLRDLLSPGLPGSAFLKAPASWGQMTDSSSQLRDIRE
jgi:hypothetical protein